MRSRRNRWMIAVALVATATAAGTQSAAAQQAGPWTFTAMFGTTDAGPGPDVTASFLAEQFTQNTECPRWPCQNKGEMTETGIGATGYPWLMEVRYAVVPWAGLGLQYSKTEIGRTKGTKTGTGHYLRVSYEADVISPTVWVAFRDLVRVGGGYARYGARMNREDLNLERQTKDKSAWGPLLEGALAVPVYGPVRIEARAQYRPVGDLDYGPYQASEFNDSQIFGPSTADFSHWFYGLGIAVNFGSLDPGRRGY